MVNKSRCRDSSISIKSSNSYNINLTYVNITPESESLGVETRVYLSSPA